MDEPRSVEIYQARQNTGQSFVKQSGLRAPGCVLGPLIQCPATQERHCDVAGRAVDEKVVDRHEVGAGERSRDPEFAFDAVEIVGRCPGQKCLHSHHFPVPSILGGVDAPHGTHSDLFDQLVWSNNLQGQSYLISDRESPHPTSPSD